MGRVRLHDPRTGPVGAGRYGAGARRSGGVQRPSARNRDVLAGREGFTLIELLVVVGIIAILVSILLPMLGKAKARSQFVACKANIRSIVQAHAMYRAEWDDLKPPLWRKKTVSTRYDWVSPDIRWDGYPVGQGLLVERGYLAVTLLMDPSAEMREDVTRDLTNWQAAGPMSGGSSYAYYWRPALSAGTALADAPRGVTYNGAINAEHAALVMDINAEQGHSYLGEYAGKAWQAHPRIGRTNVGYIDGTVADFPAGEVVLKFPGQMSEELAWFDEAHRRVFR